MKQAFSHMLNDDFVETDGGELTKVRDYACLGMDGKISPERIARVIRYLDEHYADQPALSELATRAGLSEHHFHRLFSTWAAITPKDFLQCLTLSHVKRLLESGKDILETALDAGLSGPGRLHDLCVHLEAASPGELKSGGRNWTIVAGLAVSPFGTCLVAESPRGICHLAFVDAGDAGDAWKELEERWPRARLRRDDAVAAQIAGRIFARPSSRRAKRPLRAFVKGTPFQVRVWRALLEVPPGRLITYGRLASVLGQPSAARAVGSIPLMPGTAAMRSGSAGFISAARLASDCGGEM